MSRCIVDNDTSDMCPQFHTSISLAGVFFMFVSFWCLNAQDIVKLVQYRAGMLI